MLASSAQAYASSEPAGVPSHGVQGSEAVDDAASDELAGFEQLWLHHLQHYLVQHDAPTEMLTGAS